MKKYIKLHNFTEIYDSCLLNVANYNSDANILIDHKVYINLSNKISKDVFEYHFNNLINNLISFKLGEKLLILNSNDYNYNISENIVIEKIPFIKHIKKTWNDFKKQNPKITLGLHLPYNLLEENVYNIIGKDFIEKINYTTYIISDKSSNDNFTIEDLTKIRKKLFIRNLIT